MRPPSTKAKAAVRTMLSHIDSDPIQINLQSCQLRITRGKGQKDRHVLFPTSFRGGPPVAQGQKLAVETPSVNDLCIDGLILQPLSLRAIRKGGGNSRAGDLQNRPVRALRCEPAACRWHPALASRWRGACGPTPSVGISGQGGMGWADAVSGKSRLIFLSTHQGSLRGLPARYPCIFAYGTDL